MLRLMIAANHAQIEAAVMRGQRPDLRAITGPETLVNHIKDCITSCWDQSPDSRPSFAGIDIACAYYRQHCAQRKPPVCIY